MSQTKKDSNHPSCRLSIRSLTARVFDFRDSQAAFEELDLEQLTRVSAGDCLMILNGCPVDCVPCKSNSCTCFDAGD